VHKSDFLDNGDQALRFEAKADSNIALDATDNWWGTTDSASIEAIVFHQPDSAICPEVCFVPFAQSFIPLDDSVATSVPSDQGNTLPTEFSLAQNYPNPFNNSTQIEFRLAHSSQVELVVYDLLGRRVATLVDQYLPAGSHRTSFDGTDADGVSLPSGVYFYRLKTGGGVLSRKMLLLK